MNKQKELLTLRLKRNKVQSLYMDLVKHQINSTTKIDIHSVELNLSDDMKALLEARDTLDKEIMTLESEIDRGEV